MILNDLPGSELILPGIDDLRQGKTDTVGALLVAIAFTRLTAAGLDIPQNCSSDPELKLYDSLQNERDDAYSYYNALLRRFLKIKIPWAGCHSRVGGNPGSVRLFTKILWIPTFVGMTAKKSQILMPYFSCVNPLQLVSFFLEITSVASTAFAMHLNSIENI